MSTLDAVEPAAGSRRAAALADVLRKRILSNEIEPGRLLPSERQLARRYTMGTQTVRKALKILKAEALIQAEDRRGYRVLPSANNPDRGCPVAFVTSASAGSGEEYLHRALLRSLQVIASRRGWNLLGVGLESRSRREVVESLQTARVWGAVVDTLDEALLSAIEGAGIPAVMNDAWLEDSGFESVVQDGFIGGLLAAEWLLERGHKQIAYFGHELDVPSPRTVERFSGACGALAKKGLPLPLERCYEFSAGEVEKVCRKAREVLSGPERPTGILALWQGISEGVARAAQELGLILGRDLDLVGWSTAEHYRDEYLRKMPDDYESPAITWKIETMSEICLARLETRRSHPQLPISKTRVPVSLSLRNRS
jgi:DNA-binding LacI/PurR family transcriptional regulator